VVWQLLRAEVLKVRTTRITWALLLGMALLVVGVVCIAVGATDEEELAGEAGVRTILPSGAQIAYLFALAAGIVGMASEYRHGTIGQTLLAAPQRWQVIVAKVGAWFLVGLIFGAVATLLTYGISGPWMEAKGAGWSLENRLPKEIIAGGMLGSGLFAAIGVGLAALLRDQILALLVGVGWTIVVDSTLTAIVPEVGRWFPTGALAALLNQGGEDLFEPPAGGLLLLAYAVAFVAAGALVAQRRDLT
jgi:ABC-2 type transport system permease protein